MYHLLYSDYMGHCPSSGFLSASTFHKLDLFPFPSGHTYYVGPRAVASGKKTLNFCYTGLIFCKVAYSRYAILSLKDVLHKT
jgi:hypothetical protein